MNRASNQLFACAGFSLDKNRGIGGRDPFDLFQHYFKRTTSTNELLEFTRIVILVTGPQPFESSPICCHQEPPGGLGLLSGSTIQSCSNTLEQTFIVERF